MNGEWILLRPGWLLGLLPLLVLVWLMWRRTYRSSIWDGIVDEVLREHVLENRLSSPARWPIAVLGFVWVLVVVILVGPSWEQRALPAFRSLAAQVVVLDLSRSMDATDLKPTRLTRAKHKLTDLLSAAKGTQTALVVFSEVPYVISPLTDDVNTLTAFLPELESSVLPVQGSRLAPAIQKASELLQNASVERGRIILITDASVDDAALRAARVAVDAGHLLSVLAVGTPAGEPILEANGQFLEDRSGRIVIPRLDVRALRRLSDAGRGEFTVLSTDDSDLQDLGFATDETGSGSSSGHDAGVGAAAEAVDQEVIQWIERAPWLLMLVVPLAALAFRRGLL